MRPSELETLRLLSHAPLADRLEAAALSGWSTSAVYNAVESLEREGLAASFPHASDLVPPTRRYHPTAEGVRVLAREEGIGVDALLRSRPVSAQWLRLLLERLDAVAVVYRLASERADAAFPFRLRLYRAAPVDAAIALPDGRVIAVVRQGPASDRTGFAKRLWRLRGLPKPAAILLLMPDEVRLRQARRLLRDAPFIAYLALESDAAAAGPETPVWRASAGTALLDLRAALDRTGPPGQWPSEQPPARASLPDAIGSDSETNRLLPILLKPAEKRALGIVADWPWLSPAHLGAILGLKRSRLSEVVGRLTQLGCVQDTSIDGRRRLAATDRALAAIARADRASVGAARRRWSPTLIDPGEPIDWRNVSGARTRQLLRNVEHTEAVHAFIAALARQARALGWEAVQVDPPRRASRYFRHRGKLHSVQPDASGVLQGGDAVWPFFLEWERRAVRPVTMAARLAPYLRYFSSARPIEDHGAQPQVLVVFDDDLAHSHFLRIADREMTRTDVHVPLMASHRHLLEREGPLGRAWFAPGAHEPIRAFRSR
ncbi:MAG: MarR family transcriptional regulator [Chloroflexi bacterium]|nr:MarR family transcriptional regulator [Chloroflexota bacterium]MYB83648.1 MarR family transcriptional regulator [Chloroflexota bacterium]